MMDYLISNNLTELLVPGVIRPKSALPIVVGAMGILLEPVAGQIWYDGMFARPNGRPAIRRHGQRLGCSCSKDRRQTVPQSQEW